MSDAGFELIEDEVIPTDEPGHGVVNLVLARKP
jgi:hypothetical protein